MRSCAVTAAGIYTTNWPITVKRKFICVSKFNMLCVLRWAYFANICEYTWICVSVAQALVVIVMVPQGLPSTAPLHAAETTKAPRPHTYLHEYLTSRSSLSGLQGNHFFISFFSQSLLKQFPHNQLLLNRVLRVVGIYITHRQLRHNGTYRWKWQQHMASQLIRSCHIRTDAQAAILIKRAVPLNYTPCTIT